MDHSHSPEAIRQRLTEPARHSYTRDWVYGGIDGAVTTFAIVSGIQGAALDLKTIIILGLANIVADGFSMAASNYMGTRAEIDELAHIKKVEERHIDQHPQGEREEVVQLLSHKGFSGELLDKTTEFICADKKRWIDFMLVEEYGLPLRIRSAKMAAFSTFLAFGICGSLPMLPFVFKINNPFNWATGITCFVFFMIGSLKSRWSLTHWSVAGLSTLFLGGLASAMAYLVGYLLGS